MPSHEPTPSHASSHATSSQQPSHEPTPSLASSNDNASGLDHASTGRSARAIANAVRERYDGYSVDETPLASAADLLAQHGADGVTQANADEVWAVLADDNFWFC